MQTAASPEADVDSAPEAQSRQRRIKKLLDAIDRLRTRTTPLNPDQVTKLGREPALRAELERLTVQSLQLALTAPEPSGPVPTSPLAPGRGGRQAHSGSPTLGDPATDPMSLVQK